MILGEFNGFEAILSKINPAFILKLSIEIFLFLIVIRLAKRGVEILFGKLIVKVDDHEIKRQYRTIKFLLTSFINVVLFLFFATNFLGALGIDMKPILATAGVFGVAIGFGAKKFVEDVITGLTILLTGQVRIGDYVTLSGATGTVEIANLLLVKVRTYNGDVHYIRNGLIDKVINHTRDFSNPVVEIPVSYNSNIKLVLETLRELCNSIKNDPDYSLYILSEPEIVAIDAFLDSSLLFKVRFKTTTLQQWAIQRKFRIMVKEKFDELNIEIPYNKLDVYVKS